MCFKTFLSSRSLLPNFPAEIIKMNLLYYFSELHALNLLGQRYRVPAYVEPQEVA